MTYFIEKGAVIDYPPEALNQFHIYGFEWIDNLHFLRSPDEFVGPAAKYREVAHRRFLQAGWEGDGEITLIWLPPFVFPLSLNISPVGIVVWHVKQKSDGVSFILSPIPLPFEEFGPYQES
jgi:hypothetical protein